MTLNEAVRILELKSPFTKRDLKRAFREALMVWHPDRFPDGSELRAKAEGRTYQINEAYALLNRLSESDFPFRAAGSAQNSQSAPPPPNPPNSKTAQQAKPPEQSSGAGRESAQNSQSAPPPPNPPNSKTAQQAKPPEQSSGAGRDGLIVGGIVSLILAVLWYIIFLPARTEADRIAAEAGNIDAQFRMGMAYRAGSGVPQDNSQALEWFSKAAAGNHKGAKLQIMADNKALPFTNSLGMTFVPAGTPGVLFSVCETRVKDFETFVEDSGHDAISDNEYGVAAFTLESGGQSNQAGGSWRDPRFQAKQSLEHPVVCVSYLDAEAFCAWLTKKERANGTISAGASYRLPSDTEWGRACDGSEYPWGDTYPPTGVDGNYLGAEGMTGALEGMSTNLSEAGFRDAAARTSVVGMFKENRFGLHDMGGNVSELCSTWYTADLNDEELKKEAPMLRDDGGGQTYRVLRGASWASFARLSLRSSSRDLVQPRNRSFNQGFRVVIVVGE